MQNEEKPKASQTKLKFGLAIEEKVAKHFDKNNFEIVARNFRCKLGEIDLIVKEKFNMNAPLLFIEIRYRRSDLYGSAAESINFKKQQKLIKTAEFFLKCHPHYQQLACRFDVVAIQNTRFEWIQNAFQA